MNGDATDNPHEQIYRQLFDDVDLKMGTYYERLAAAVIKILDRENVVIHDIKVIGQVTGVKHQIDVHLSRAERAIRMLIECKDFFLSEDKVGLGVVRDFIGVCIDIKPDAAAIVSATGFTRDAIKYAINMTFDDGKRIQLATLRQFDETDWTNRIREVHLNLNFKMQRPPQITIEADHDRLTADEIEQLRQLPQSPIATAEQMISAPTLPQARALKHFLTEALLAIPFHQMDAAGELSLPPEAVIEISGHKVPIRRIKWRMVFDPHVQTVVAGAGKVASLVQQLVDEADGTTREPDRIIWTDELTEWCVNPETGEVENRST